jgi:hypothetical protein
MNSSHEPATADTLLDRLGRLLARILEREPAVEREPARGKRYVFAASDEETLLRVMRPGDVLLVEGRSKLSTAIKYLTQSTWSHAALYVGEALARPQDGRERLRLIEVILGDGCIAVPLSKYANQNSRICRPVGLTPEDRDAIVAFMIARLGTRYDLKNFLDLVRYFLPTPPVPARFRRRMIALGSGNPTRAICSTLIAQAFQSVRYPILPITKRAADHHPMGSGYSRRDLLHIRHHSLYAPRDFDLSPYFAVVKPTVYGGFKYKNLSWAEPRDANGGPPLGETLGGDVVE